MAGALVAVSCSSGPAPPAKGTPPFLWSWAGETFATGDYQKTAEHLEGLAKTDNEFSARARPWRLVLLAGLVQGYIDLGEAAESGARNNKAGPGPYRKLMSDYRSHGSRRALEFAQAFGQFEKSQSTGDVTLAFTIPKGSAAPGPEINRMAAGFATPGQAGESMVAQALQRGVLLASSRAAGAPDDPAKARELLKSPPAAVPRNTFLLAMAQSLYDQAQLFHRKKLDLPDKFSFFMTQAGDVLKALPETKESKELTKKIQAALKDAKQK
jgi:hypothetical protein